MRFWTELAFIMTTTSRWRKWCRRFKTSRESVPAVSAGTDGEEEEEVAETLRRRACTLEPVKPPQRRLRLWSSTRPRRWGIARIQLGLIQACRWVGSFTVPPGSASAARFGHTRTAPGGSQICKWHPLERNGQGRAAGRGDPART
jgi:hypothetical protein